METQFKTFKTLLESSHSFILSTHLNPDCDAIGSEIAMARFLQSGGKSVRIINQDATPSQCRFLDPDGLIEVYSAPAHDALFTSADAIIVLDLNDVARVGSFHGLISASPARKVCIDHHLDPKRFADLEIFDVDSPATGDILYRLFTSINRERLAQSIAVPLYAAIMTDTGSFRFPRTDARIFRMAADLIDAGADPVAVYRSAYEQGTHGRLVLLGSVLEGIKLEYGGRVAYTRVTRSMFERTETTEPDTENFINYALQIDGVVISLLFTELNGWIKLGFRSKGAIPINLLAREFGGNGHMNAAGARVAGKPMDEVIPEVLAACSKYLRTN